MPLYEYQCKECSGKFEALVSYKNADNHVECPHCNSKETERQLSTFSASVGSSKSGAACEYSTGSSCNAPGGT